MPLFDEVGYWSEVKLAIIREYAKAYSTILTARGFHHVYIDAFAGAGLHMSRRTREFIPGSPRNALWIEPPFREYYFIDIDERKVESLEGLAGERPDVHVLHGDCNKRLLLDVFPKIRYEQFRRGLCLLDPYGLQLDWEVIRTAGQMRSIEIFLNFPVMDINRNVLWSRPESVPPGQVDRMNRFWGDDSWRSITYTQQRTLFGDVEEEKKRGNKPVTEAFRDRLRDVAGFGYVPDPMPMRTPQGAIVYYLFLAHPS